MKPLRVLTVEGDLKKEIREILIVSKLLNVIAVSVTSFLCLFAVSGPNQTPVPVKARKRPLVHLPRKLGQKIETQQKRLRLLKTT